MGWGEREREREREREVVSWLDLAEVNTCGITVNACHCGNVGFLIQFSEI